MSKDKKEETKSLPTVDIKGKPYVLTQHRLLEFHRLYPNGSISTDIVTDSQDSVVMITKVVPDVKVPERAFTGIAQETRGSTFINKTSHYENCETSSRARALSNLGIGVEESCASAEEVANAMIQQSEDKTIKGIKEAILHLMSIYEAAKKWLPKAVELGVVKSDIMNVSLGYVLNSKSIEEADERVRKTNLRFTKFFEQYNEKTQKESSDKGD
tara:strand:- start:741 stop:1382 length:642 start_codon:yes stop_codon:yes gene_type:complete